MENDRFHVVDFHQYVRCDDIEKIISQRDELLSALKEADLFIKNGIELGFIKMPDKDTPDRAHKISGIVSSAIAKCEVKS